MENDALNSPPVLELEDLTLVRGRRRIYEHLTVSFSVGVTALLGPNGAGKTTLLEALLEPARARHGHIRLDGLGVPGQVPLAKYLSRVGHMPQDWGYFSGFSVQESVEYAAWLKGVPSAELRSAALEAIGHVDLSEQRSQKVRKLSGGMRQRVGLAETFVNDPRVVLLDEPTVGLDPAQRSLLRQYVTSSAQDRAIVMSTHLTDDVDAVADRVVVVDNGKITFDGTPSDLRARATGTHRGASALEDGYLSVLSPAAQAGLN